MQKIIRQAEKAARTRTKQLQKKADHQKKGESFQRSQNRIRVSAYHNELIRQDRRNRSIDWEAGPLAPRRDVGNHATTYGALPMYNFQPPEVDPENRPKWLHIREGDRVVITKGRDKGRIGTVQEVNEDHNAVQVKDLNMIDIALAPWMKEQNQESKDVVSTPQLISLKDVKLVYPLPDPQTGVPRDVVIERVVQVNKAWDATKKEFNRGERAIAGTNTIIPWPEEADPVYEDNDDDTLRISVEEQTFRPYLMRPPMPLSVIDELRNKYSRYRTRHDYDYRTAKELEDTKAEDRKQLIKTMQTPRQQLAELKAQQKAAEAKELTPEQLTKIGEVIAQEQAKAKGAVRAMSIPRVVGRGL